MGEKPDQDLLRAYATTQSEAAFAELVRRYLDLVYSVALRMTRDHHHAEDVSQCVFQALARQAGSLRNGAALSGWLHRATHHVSAQLVRTAVRRRGREGEAGVLPLPSAAPESEMAWQTVEAQLDEALSGLAPADREAILLRYFRRLSAREVASELGLSAEAAQKRVSRAVERLREALAARGINAGTAALALGLAEQGVCAPPVSLAASISAVVAAAGSCPGLPVSGSIASLLMSPLQKSLVAALVLGSVGFGAFEVQQARVQRADLQRVQAERAALGDEVARLNLEKGEWTARELAMQSEVAGARSNHVELLRLRGEVGRLKEEKRDSERRLAALQAGAKPAATKTATPVRRASPTSPFQLRLVVDGASDSAETLAMQPAHGAESGARESVSVERQPLMDHALVRSVAVIADPLGGGPQIEVQFNDEGREEFARLTREHLNQRLAIALDGRV